MLNCEITMAQTCVNTIKSKVRHIPDTHQVIRSVNTDLQFKI